MTKGFDDLNRGDALANPISIRRVTATAENARRLAESYARYYWDDERLVAAVVRAKRATDETEAIPDTANSPAIDGHTEQMSADDFLRDLSMPETLALEAPVADSADSPPLGFIILRYATNESASIESFARFTREMTLNGKEVVFRANDGKARLDSALAHGNIVGFVELVGGTGVTKQLFAAASALIWRDRLGGAQCHLISKVLDQVVIGGHTNPVGNERARKMTMGLGLEPIGMIEQVRPLKVSAEFTRSLGINAPPTEAILRFAVYLGDTTRAGAEALAKIER